MTEEVPLHIFECRKHNKIEVHADQMIVKGLVVIDPTKEYLLFPACSSCGYGSKVTVLKSRDPPFEYYDVRRCTLRNVGVS